MYQLDPQVRREIEEALGSPLPERVDLGVLSGLEQKRPDLYRKVVDGLAVSPRVTLPSQAFRERARRRGRVRQLVERVLMKPAWPDGMIVDRRRVMAIVLVTFAFLFLPAVYFANRVSRYRTEKAPQPEAAGQPQASGNVAGVALAEGKKQDAGEQLGTAAAASPRVGGGTGNLPLLPPPPAGPLEVPGSAPERGTASGGIFAYQAAQAGPGRPPLFVYEGSSQTQREPRIFVYTSEPPQARTAGEQQPSSTVASGGTSGGPSGGPTRPEPASAWRIGEIVPATLITGVATVSGLDPVPVVASSAPPGGCMEGERCEPAVWLGHARYAGGGRMSIEFSQVSVGSRVLGIRATALGSDMVTGIPAKLSMKTPTLAAQLIGAAVGAAGDYFRALASRQQVTITNGWLTISQSGEPQFWQFLAAKIADLFRVGSTGPATVQVAEVSPKTSVNLLILQEGR